MIPFKHDIYYLRPHTLTQVDNICDGDGDFIVWEYKATWKREEEAFYKYNSIEFEVGRIVTHWDIIAKELKYEHKVDLASCTNGLYSETNLGFTVTYNNNDIVLTVGTCADFIDEIVLELKRKQW